MPRPRLRRRVPSSGGSSVVRNSGSSSDSGLVRRTTVRRGSPSGTCSASSTDALVNGYDSTSTYPFSASARPTERLRRCPAVSPRPGGATGSTLGTLSYPSSRTTSSAKSAGWSRSGRHVGGVTTRTSPTGATAQPIPVSSPVTRSASYGTPATRDGRSAATRTGFGATT